MNNGLHAETESIYQEGNNTINNSENFSNLIMNLNDNVNELMGIWNGPSANIFKSECDRQIVELREFNNILNTKGQNIVKGSQMLDDAENQNISDAKKLF